MQHLEAVEFGHHRVEDDEVGPLGRRLPQPLFAALGRSDFEAALAQLVFD